MCAAAAGIWASAVPAADTYVPGDRDDPNVRAARFLGADERFFSALAELLRLQVRDGENFEAAPEYWEALAEFYLSFGMRDQAETLYRNVAATAADPLVAGRSRLRMAEFEYERGYLDEARASLLRAREKLPSTLIRRWQDLYSRVLLAQGRYSEAVDLLAKSDTSRDEDAGYLRLNLGIALINAGEEGRGRTVLDRVGRMDTRDPELMALRDRANVTLGWHFLQNRLGGSAKPVLSRVRSEGIYANRALLGLGWAEMAPTGTRQLRSELPEDERARRLQDPYGTSGSALGILLRPGFADDPYASQGIRSFRRSKGGSNEAAALRRALVYWGELIERDPQDPAVQEVWLAIPYALDRLGAHTQAVKYYEQAATRLEAARKRTTDAIKAIEGGRMVETIVRRDADAEAGWMWELRDLPDAPETYYLQSVIAEHRFAEAMKNYRDSRMLLRRIDAWVARIGQMEKAPRENLLSDTPDPRVLFDRARRNSVAARHEPLVLRADPNLAEPGRYARPGPSVTPARPVLRLSARPQSFNRVGGAGSSSGGGPNLEKLRTRAESLRPALLEVSAEQGRMLLNIGREELRAQKVQIEKYLGETRFALARLYDREVPNLDQDEFEIFKKGEKRPPGTDRGEYEILK